MVSCNGKTKKRHFEKKGKELTKQRVRYSVIENFSSSYKSDSSDYRQLLISELEDDASFYQMDITPSVLVSQLWWIRTDIREDFLCGKGVVQKPTNTYLNYSE